MVNDALVTTGTDASGSRILIAHVVPTDPDATVETIRRPLATRVRSAMVPSRFLLREALPAVLGQTRPPDRVIVVDNASTDGTPAAVRADFPGVVLVSLPVGWLLGMPAVTKHFGGRLAMIGAFVGAMVAIVAIKIP